MLYFQFRYPLAYPDGSRQHDVHALYADAHRPIHLPGLVLLYE